MSSSSNAAPHQEMEALRQIAAYGNNESALAPQLAIIRAALTAPAELETLIEDAVVAAFAHGREQGRADGFIVVEPERKRAIRDAAKADIEAANALRAALRSQPSSQQGWRTIESAPKDGTLVLLLNANQGNVRAVASFVRAYERWESTGATVFWQPTHWAPLPAPPSRTEAE